MLVCGYDLWRVCGNIALLRSLALYVLRKANGVPISKKKFSRRKSKKRTVRVKTNRRPPRRHDAGGGSIFVFIPRLNPKYIGTKASEYTINTPIWLDFSPIRNYADALAAKRPAKQESNIRPESSAIETSMADVTL